MKQKVEAFIRQYRSVRKRTVRLLDVVQPEHLNFTYMEGKFTVADQIRHIAAIERYLYAETLMGNKSLYNGCGADLAEGYDNILQFFHQTHQETKVILGRLTDTDLEDECLTPTGYSIPKGKWLELLLEHEIHHRAEIYLYLNLMAVKTPPIYGLTAEEVQQLSQSTS